MNFISNVLRLLKTINSDYSNILLVAIAGLSAYVAYHEFILKRRPYVVPEIAYEISGKDDSLQWFFSIIFVNKGTYPGIARISKALLKIGDEEYPTAFHQELVLVPQERQLLAPIGSINAKGLAKIRGHEYKSNRVEISLEVESKSMGDKEYRYKTNYDFFVDVSGDKPIFSPILQSIQ